MTAVASALTEVPLAAVPLPGMPRAYADVIAAGHSPPTHSR